MARCARPRAGKKPAKPYHHGNLRRALLDEALRTIQTHGVEHLTLRTVGERLGVSRSALYRRFADKQSLLATVGKEGFRKLQQALADAWEKNGRGRIGFEAMGRAYVQFAVAHPSGTAGLTGITLSRGIRSIGVLDGRCGIGCLLMRRRMRQEKQPAECGSDEEDMKMSVEVSAAQPCRATSSSRLNNTTGISPIAA